MSSQLKSILTLALVGIAIAAILAFVAFVPIV